MNLRDQAERKAQGAGVEALERPSSARDLSRKEQAVPVLGQIADAVSTLYALQKNPRAREGNPAMVPLVKHPPLFVATKLVIGLGVAYVADELAEAGHKRIGRVLAWGSGLLGAGLAVHNTRLGNRG
jgi:hypothetical protein